LSQILSYSQPPRVKVCGLTSVGDALAAVNAGADAIGIVFYEPSPRNVSIDIAEQIVRAVGPFVTTVGLFVNASEEAVNAVLQSVPLQLLQFHGNESAEYCEVFQRPYMKAIRLKPGIDVLQEISRYTSAVAILLDTYKKGLPGGTGETFDWKQVPTQIERKLPLVLAGGLRPDNIQQAVDSTMPYGVDVSGGVEFSPGKKDPRKITQFINNVHRAFY
jgi:phosphoribosylanthranilate isomerase